ncbi:MAG TPA: SDR family oxidoreductase [Phycicoccus sp.]|jgi:short-subunit dehydrogenase|nr:SDR family oxidoreductase [Phycicoccus sp.]HQK31103.1 SDR family oxidoreductase [Phycicoccus sp.]HQY96475.1 SDR family oxidoreductase [Phycicoccus sp.]HRA45043.1 SDR family oxidoreductase [Phycicoccus sp.]
MTTALVTGATAGIGREFALQLAARGDDLVLVARDVDRLEALAAELRATRGVEVEVLPADLSDRAATARVAERLAEADRPIDLLVNNAGFGMKKSFLAAELAEEEAMFDVLCRAVLVLSHAAGRAMKARGQGQIINVSSVAGWIASGTYSAAKSWVTVFSEGLAGELAGSGVTVTALCPGFTRTEFHARAKIRDDAFPGFMWLDASRLVRECLEDADKGRVISVPSVLYKGLHLATKIAPRRLLRSGGVVTRHRPPTR